MEYVLIYIYMVISLLVSSIEIPGTLNFPFWLKTSPSYPVAVWRVEQLQLMASFDTAPAPLVPK